LIWEDIEEQRAKDEIDLILIQESGVDIIANLAQSLD
jgi:hypothetical protein